MAGLDVDALLEEAGSFHAFQYKYLLLLGVPWITCGCLTMVHIFVAIPPAPAEAPACPLNATAPLPAAVPSLMVEWSLLCGREHEADMLESAFMLGMLFGAGITGNAADQAGRRPALNACALGAFVGGCWSAMAASYMSYLLSRLWTGFFVAGLGLVAFVYTSEILAADRRVVNIIVSSSLFPIGVAGLSQLAFALREDWRLVQWASAVSVMGVCVCVCVCVRVCVCVCV